MEGKRKRLRFDNLDLLATLALFMVISLHVPLWNTDFFKYDSPTRIAQYFLRLLSEGVPILMMASGVRLFSRPDLDLKKHMAQVGRLVVILLVWGVILAVARGIILDGVGSLSVEKVATRLLETKDNARYTGILRFVQGLIAVYLLYPALWWVCNTEFRMFRFLFYVAAFFTVGLSFLQLLSDVGAHFFDVKMMNDAIGFLGIPAIHANAWYVFYFMLGGMIYKNQQKLRGHRFLFSLLGIVAIAASMACCYFLSRLQGSVYRTSFNYSSIFEPFWLTGLFALTCGYRNTGSPVKRFLASVRENTLGIYIMHIIFTALISRNFTLDQFYKKLISFVICFVVSYLISWALKKVPVLRALV